MADEATGPQLSNELTDDQRAKLTFQLRDKYAVALEAKKAADNAIKLVGKEIKSDLGKQGMTQIKTLIKLASPEGEQEVRDEMEARVAALRWMAIPVGTQSTLFPDADRRPITEKAFAEGKKAGLAAERHSNPYHQTNDGHNAWNEGYKAGQSVNLTGIGKLETDGKAAIDSLADRLREPPAGKA